MQKQKALQDGNKPVDGEEQFSQVQAAGLLLASLRVKHFEREAMESHTKRPCESATELCPFLSRNTHEHKKKQGRQHKLDKPAAHKVVTCLQASPGPPG